MLDCGEYRLQGALKGIPIWDHSRHCKVFLHGVTHGVLKGIPVWDHMGHCNVFLHGITQGTERYSCMGSYWVLKDASVLGSHMGH